MSFKSLFILLPLLFSLALFIVSGNAQVSSSVFCQNKVPLCSSGLVPVCSDANFIPTCLPGGTTSFIECCKKTSASLDCNPSLNISCVSSTSSTSSSSSGAVAKAFCQNEQVFCTSGFFPSCSNPTYSLTCLSGEPEDFPDCCRKTGTSLDCQPSFVTCSSAETSNLDKFQTVEVDVISNPRLPEVVDLPLVVDDLQGRVGYAFPDSSPSFEIRLPISDPELEIFGVDIKDKTGFVFNNVPFSIIDIPSNPEKKILNLVIPESAAIGEARFALNFSSGESLAGVIEIIERVDVKVFKKRKGLETIDITKPFITRLNVARKGQKVTLTIRGLNFLGTSFLIERGSGTELIESTTGEPKTFVSVFPTKIVSKIDKINVSSNRAILKAKFDLSEPIVKELKAALVISTPEGIATSLFSIKPDEKTKAIVRGASGITCFKSKPLCPNGRIAVCTDTSFKPSCLAGKPTRIPDCCKSNIGRDFDFGDSDFDDEKPKFFKCNPSLLACPVD